MGGGALSSNVSKLGSKEVSKKLRNFSLAIKKACHCEDERSEDVAIAKSMNINEITTQSSIARNDKSLSETNLTTYRLNDLTSFLDMFFSRFTSHFSRKRVAFTLAEVLITLGIIGVVAAFTLPSVIAKYQEKVWTTSYLRVYSLLENAYRSAIYENGTVDNWPGSVKGRIDSAGRLVDIAVDKNVVYEYMFKPRLKPNESILKLSSGSTGCMPKHYNLLTGRITFTII